MTVDAVPRCWCGHAAQIHGARQLTAGGPRNQGPCSANRCICDEYAEQPGARWKEGAFA